MWEHALAAKISNAAFHICLLTKSHAMKATVCKAYVLILGWGMFVLENCWKGSAMEVASAALLPLGSKRYCETKFFGVSYENAEISGKKIELE